MNQELIKEYAKRFEGSEDYYLQHTKAVVELDNGVLLGIEKPKVETHFCFHDEGPESEYYMDLMADKEGKLRRYFFRENLKLIDEKIQALQSGLTDLFPMFIGAFLNDHQYGHGTASLSYASYHCLSDKGVVLEGLAAHEKAPYFYPLTDVEERKRILEALQQVRAAFEKRLNTWWKRYGAEKLHLWTYWADA